MALMMRSNAVMVRAASRPAMAPRAVPTTGLRTILKAVAPAEARRSVLARANRTGQDPNATKVNPVIPAFTRRREVFVGRLAMFGWLAAYIGEIIAHTGPIGQLELQLGWSREAIVALLVANVVFNAIGAAFPGSPTFSEENQRDVRKRPAGPPQDANAIADPSRFAGVDDKFGFSKLNELFVGRSAMLGFVALVVGEYFNPGKGAIAQVWGWLGHAGIPDDGVYRIAGYGLVFSAALVTFLGYALDNSGEQGSGKDIY